MGKCNNLEKGVPPPFHLSVVVKEKGGFRLPSTTVGQLTYTYK